MAEPGFNDLVIEARSAVSRGDFAAAKAGFLKALKLKPDSVDASYGLATVYYLLKDYPAAQRQFEEVQRLEPLHAGAAINLGALCNLLGQYEQAITYLRRGIQLDRSRSEGYYNLGIAYRKLGRLELAIQAYREAHHLNPRMVEAVYNLANVYFEMARYDQALTYYKRALEINPGFRKAYEGVQRTEKKIKESRRPLESGIIVTDTTAGDPMETDARLDRLLTPEHDHDTLGQLHKQAEQAQQAGEKWLQSSEAFNHAVRNLGIHLSSGAEPQLVAQSIQELRQHHQLFRQAFTRFTESCQSLGKLRDRLVEG